MVYFLPLNYFNSIKVRLEPSKRFLNISIELFQFHKGAIRTNYPQVEGEMVEISIP